MSYELDRVRRSERRQNAPAKSISGSPATLGKVTTASPAVGKFLNWHPVTMIGDEVEGHAPTLEVHAGITLQAELVQGTASQNDVIMFRWTDWRWVTEGKGATPGCEAGRICVTVQSSGCSWAITGATVTLKDSGGNVIDTGTTSGSPGQVCFDLPAPGLYTVISHVPGATDRTATVNAVCDVDSNVTLTYPTGSIGRVCFSFTNCDCDGSHPVGANVTVSGAATASVSTDPTTGQACLVLGVGDYEATVTYPSGFTKTMPFGFPPCGTANVSAESVSAISVRAGRCLPGCAVTFTMLTGATGSCSATASGTNAQCCITFGSPVEIGTSLSMQYVTSGVNSGTVGFSAQCFTTSIPFVIDFANTC